MVTPRRGSRQNDKSVKRRHAEGSVERRALSKDGARHRTSHLHSPFQNTDLTWLVPNKPHVNRLVEKHHANSSLRKQRANRLRRRAVLKSRTASVRVPWRCVRFVVIRSRPNCSSANYLFNGWFVKLPRTSRRIFVFNRQPSAHFKRRVKLIWSHSSKTPIYALSMPNGSR